MDKKSVKTGAERRPKDKFDEKWYNNFEALIKYKEKYGDCNVPGSWKENKKFANWIYTQRQNYKKGTLPIEKVKKLEEIGFLWNHKDIGEKIWQNNFQTLIIYKEKYGDCDVLERWAENKLLGGWVVHQRMKYRKGLLPEKKIRQLEKIGFVWKLLNKRWDDRFKQLVLYKEQYGNCNVPQEWKENIKLARWVNTQRTNYRKGALSEERERRLEETGFKWNVNVYPEISWKKNFQALKKYKKKYGNCNVPQKWKENIKLGIWVSSQRENYKKGILSEERIRQLEEISFKWSCRR